MASLVVETSDGLTLYATIEQVGTLELWNTFIFAFEAYNPAHWYGVLAPNYSIAASKTVQSANISARYSITVPASLPAGSYIVRWYSQQGATPAVTDGAWIFEQPLAWTGGAIVDAFDVGGKVLGAGSSDLIGVGVQTSQVSRNVTVTVRPITVTEE